MDKEAGGYRIHKHNGKVSSGGDEVRRGGLYSKTPSRLLGRTSMDEKKLAEDLHREGFQHTFVWQDGPNAYYPDHQHAAETAHIVLNGEITLTVAGHTTTFHAGDRCDVPAGATHSARAGPRGCRYLIGER